MRTIAQLGNHDEASLNPSKEHEKEVFKGIRIPCVPRYSLIEDTYLKNQIIVTFEKSPSDEEVEITKKHFADLGIKGEITIKKCGDGNCNLPIQLWQAEGIDTVIS